MKNGRDALPAGALPLGHPAGRPSSMSEESLSAAWAAAGDAIRSAGAPGPTAALVLTCRADLDGNLVLVEQGQPTPEQAGDAAALKAGRSRLIPVGTDGDSVVILNSVVEHLGPARARVCATDPAPTSAPRPTAAPTPTPAPTKVAPAPAATRKAATKAPAKVSRRTAPRPGPPGQPDLAGSAGYRSELDRDSGGIPCKEDALPSSNEQPAVRTTPLLT